MDRKPEKPRDVTGEEVVPDKDLEKVVGGYAPKLSKRLGADDCECAACGLSASIRVDNYNQAADPDA